MTDSTSRDTAFAVAHASERRVAKDEFAEQLHTFFTTRGATDATFCAELVEFSERAAAPGYEQFSLVFRAPVGTAPVQKTYALEHPVLGGLQLFLVPVGRDADGLYFEAAFSRPLAPRSGAED